MAASAPAVASAATISSRSACRSSPSSAISAGAATSEMPAAAISAQAVTRHQIQRSTSTTPIPAPISRLVCQA